jgi:hypothetical protein
MQRFGMGASPMTQKRSGDDGSRRVRPTPVVGTGGICRHTGSFPQATRPRARLDGGGGALSTLTKRKAAISLRDLGTFTRGGSRRRVPATLTPETDA